MANTDFPESGPEPGAKHSAAHQPSPTSNIAADYVWWRWQALKLLFKAGPWLTGAILIITSLVLAVGVQDRPAGWSLFALEKASVLTITGSILASGLFFTLYTLISIVRRSEGDALRSYWEMMHDGCGVKGWLDVRGSPLTYEKCIGRAKTRVWAIGMTNLSFFSNHNERIKDLLESRQVDVRVAFWDPRSRIVRGASSDLNLHLLDIQSSLEGEAERGETWERTIRDRYTPLLKAVEQGSVRGKLRVYYLTMPTNFSCLVVDDDVFFFPFLSRTQSWQQPILHASASAGVGAKIIDHLNLILGSRFADLQAEVHGG